MDPDLFRFTGLALAGLATAATTWIATGWLRRALRRWQVLDTPGERSSHSVPTPRGGGLAVVPVVAAAWLAYAAIEPADGAGLAPVVGVALVLAVVFWRDDVRGLSIGLRIAAQALAVAVVLAISPPQGLVFGGLLPPAADTLATAALWMWFMNLFNFMDGIDGITGVETAAVGVGVALVAGVAGLTGGLAFAGLTLAAAAVGFLVWNWNPASIFLGDVGSVPLGFLTGWLLLELAAAGQPIAALILPAYYLVDSGVTLGHRFIRGERVWKAHREHFYQRAVIRGMSHAAVVRHILVVDLVLIGLAIVAAEGRPALAVAGAALGIAALLMTLAGPKWRRRGKVRALDGLASADVRHSETVEPKGLDTRRTGHDRKDISS